MNDLQVYIVPMGLKSKLFAKRPRKDEYGYWRNFDDPAPVYFYPRFDIVTPCVVRLFREKRAGLTRVTVKDRYEEIVKRSYWEIIINRKVVASFWPCAWSRSNIPLEFWIDLRALKKFQKAAAK